MVMVDEMTVVTAGYPVLSFEMHSAIELYPCALQNSHVRSGQYSLAVYSTRASLVRYTAKSFAIRGGQ
jgi:hypothetical protein